MSDDVTSPAQGPPADSESSDYAAAIVKTLREPLVVLDGQLRVKEASAAFYRVFDVAPDQTVGRLIYELGDGQWDIPALRARLDDLLRNAHSSFDDFSVDHDFPGVGQRTMLLNARRLPAIGETKLILLAIDDITPRRKSERQLSEQARLLNLSNDVIIVRDVNNCITYWNHGAEETFGYTRDEAVGRNLHTLLKTEFEHPFEELVAELRKTSRMIGEVIQYAKDGRRVAMLCRWSQDYDDQGNPASILTTATDVTKRRAADELIEVSELRYRRLFEAAHDGILILNVSDRKIIDVNQFMLDLLGYPREHFIGKEMWEIGIFKDKAESQAAMQELDEKGSIRYDDKDLEDRNGGRHAVEIVANVHQEDHHPVIQANIRDISERKRAEEELRTSEERFRLIVSIITDLPWTTDDQGAFVVPQLAWEKFTGQSWDEHRGFGWANALHPEDRETVKEIWEAAYRTRSLYESRGRLWHARSKQYRHFVARAAPLFNANGDVRAWVGACTDSHDAEALRESEERFRTAIGAVSGIIWTNNGEGKMEGEQPGWSAFTGQSREEYEGYGWSKAVHPEDAQPTIDAWAQAVAEKRTFVFEHRIRRRDGEWRVCSIRAVPVFNANGTIREWVGVHADITEQVAGQEDLRCAKEAAEAASRAKDVFLATLSHELRTPLNAILGWSSILQIKGASPDDLDKGLEVISRNGKAQAQLIEDMLDVSGIVSGKLRLNIAQCDMTSAIRAAMDVVRPSAEAKGINLVAELDPSAELGMCDSARLQQVMWNLLTNAVKFTPRGGAVRVTLSRERSTTRIAVSDTGRGIAPEFLPHVFERFRQADSSATRTFGGLGLGLSIVKHIVEAHGGTVRAESAGENPPGGSTFTIELPIRADRATDAPGDGGEEPEDEGPASTRKPAMGRTAAT